MRQKGLSLFLMLSAGLPWAGAQASIINLSPESFSAALSMGILAGESHERVYNASTGHQQSELDWKLKNSPVIKGELSWDIFPRLTLTARGWTTLASSGSHMDDYDWMDPNQESPTDWSTHPASRLNHANEFDLSAKGWLLKQENYRLGAMLGYQKTRFSWSSHGGTYSYGNGEMTGEYPDNDRGISYKQRFGVAYAGLVGMYRYENIEINGQVRYSPWVRARDNDEHYDRQFTYRDEANNADYYAAMVDVGYYVTPNAKVFAEFSWTRYDEGKGGTEIRDNLLGGPSLYVHGDAAGIENENYVFVVGLQYRF
ncbi:omptin family outer membrane protease [Leclercia sp. 119287]|nr:omptin family outer membrane protease [Leclercia sp. 119287]QGU17501.1 omptin family outer membrane protease [Leclercia sp. 119287]